MKHLFQKAMPDRINWDKHGIMTIDGNERFVVKNSNITDLINDAMHSSNETEKKIHGFNKKTRQ